MTDVRMPTLLGQMAALANFMHVDGRECFASLSEASQTEMRGVFERLSGELQALVTESEQPAKGALARAGQSASPRK